MPLAPALGEPDPGGLDCVACGRCCHHGPRTVHLLIDDDARMGRLLPMFTDLEPKPPGFRFMKNDGEKCAALDTTIPGRFPCKVYDVRPDDCRLVDPGSQACLDARRLGHLGTSVDFRRRAD